MIKWEYHQVELVQPMDNDRLQSRGRNGWELVSVALYRDTYLYVFKRPLVDD